MKNIVLAVCMLLISAERMAAQTPDVMLEMVKLNKVLVVAKDLTFNIAFYYEEDDSVGTNIDTLTGTGAIGGGKSVMQLGEIIKVNNAQYSVLIDTTSKEVFVSDAEDMVKHQLHARFTDEAYMNSYVDTATITDSSGYRIIDISFKAMAPFNYYRIAYDSSEHRVAYMQYSMKKDTDTEDKVQARRLKVVYSSYSVGSAMSVFDVSTWFTRTNGVLVLKPAYSDYTITDLTTTER